MSANNHDGRNRLLLFFTRLSVVALTTAALLVAAVACEAGADPQPTSPAATAQATQVTPRVTARPAPSTDRVDVSHPALALAPAGSGAFEEVLSLVPDTAENRSSVLIDDYEALREQLDLAAPGPEAGSDEVLAYVVSLALAIDDRTWGSGLLTRDNRLFGPHDHLRDSDTYP